VGGSAAADCGRRRLVELEALEVLEAWEEPRVADCGRCLVNAVGADLCTPSSGRASVRMASGRRIALTGRERPD